MQILKKNAEKKVAIRNAREYSNLGEGELAHPELLYRIWGGRAEKTSIWENVERIMAFQTIEEKCAGKQLQV